MRLFGGDKYTSLNPAGYRRFIDMAHDRGIKVLTYFSSGYTHFKDPDYRDEWVRPGDRMIGGWWEMARAVPASPDWRSYLLPRLIKILNEYDTDGLYNDWGYRPNHDKQKNKELAKDEIAAFEETVEYDGAKTDLLALIYSEVKRRGKILKLHCDFANKPHTNGMKVYDYLIVGEGVGNVDRLREAVKDHDPYVGPCIHMSQAPIANDDEPFLHLIPYMQFPILSAGRPFTGERGVLPNIKYPYAIKSDGYRDYCAKAWEYHNAHPNGPHVYSGWDCVPPRLQGRATHARWLKQYMPLVEEGTWVFLEISDSDLLTKPVPKDCVASAFANRDLYVVLANYSQLPQKIETAETYVSTDNPEAAPTKHWQLPKRSLRIIKRSV